MSLAELSVENVRCLKQAELVLHPGHNLIWGSNASGKTSLLEAVFLLGRGRSFRTRNSERLIRRGEPHLRVFGRLVGPPPVPVGVEVSRKVGTTAKVGGAFVQSLAELSRAFAVQVIEPGAHKLVEEGAQRRRRWLDWAVFHVEPGFIDLWSRYGRALKQRNTALRHLPDQAAAWDPELIRLGEQIAQLRRDFMAKLQPYWAQSIRSLADLDVELHYSQGWAADTTFAAALAAQPRARRSSRRHARWRPSCRHCRAPRAWPCARDPVSGAAKARRGGNDPLPAQPAFASSPAPCPRSSWMTLLPSSIARDLDKLRRRSSPASVPTARHIALAGNKPVRPAR